LRPRAPSLLFVVGLAREAKILGAGRHVVIGPDGLGPALGPDAVDLVISFGLCGALDSRLAPGALIVADRVVDGEAEFPTDSRWSARVREALPAWRGALVGSDVIAGSADGKAALARASGALAVDMESHKAARAAHAAGIAFVVVRAVSDGAAASLPLSAQAGFRPDGRVDTAAVLASLRRRPWELPDLIRTARDAGAGFKALRRAADALLALRA
jgi:hopanoid-associated phosphorylase